MTLIEFIRVLEGVAAEQPSVNMIVRDNVLRVNDNPNDRYGAFVWTQGQHTDSAVTDSRLLRFTLFYVDRLTADEGNRAEVQSVGMDTLGNIIRTLADEFDVAEWSVDTFAQRFTDQCAGAFATVAFRVPVGMTCPVEYAHYLKTVNNEYVLDSTGKRIKVKI